jgi:hypothetical protein
VQYVKICSLYGDGFYYVPGTDTCLKLGGYIRVQAEYHAGQSGQSPGTSAQMIPQAGYNRQDTNDFNYTIRALISVDVRQQTEYGTLRSYLRAGWNQSTPGVSGIGTTPCNNGAGGQCLGYWDRAFIQFAGFSVGRQQSFFDLFTYGGGMSYLNVRTTGDTGATGIALWAYSVQFGNGVSASLSLEDPNPRKGNTFDLSVPGFWSIYALTTGAGQAGDPAFQAQGGQTFNNGMRTPDIIANARIDQAWGFFGVSFASHDASGAYYGTPNNVANGHPSDKYGWAGAVGGQLNLQGGDQVGANFVWSRGAAGFATNTATWQIYHASTSVGVGWGSDGIWDLPAGSDIELTTVWDVNLGYQHIWNPKWRTSLYGGYVAWQYSTLAQNLLNSRLGGVCQAPAAAALGIPIPAVTFGPSAVAGGTFVALPGNSCNPNFSFYQIGTRTQYNPAAQLDVGLDVFYTKLNTAYKGPASYGVNPPRPIVGFLDDQNTLSFLFRVQRNFFP